MYSPHLRNEVVELQEQLGGSRRKTSGSCHDVKSTKVWPLSLLLLMAEIRSAPVEVGSLSQLFTLGFSTIPGGDRRISEPSTVLPSHSNGISPILNRIHTPSIRVHFPLLC